MFHHNMDQHFVFLPACVREKEEQEKEKEEQEKEKEKKSIIDKGVGTGSGNVCKAHSWFFFR